MSPGSQAGVVLKKARQNPVVLMVPREGRPRQGLCYHAVSEVKWVAVNHWAAGFLWGMVHGAGKQTLLFLMLSLRVSPSLIRGLCFLQSFNLCSTLFSVFPGSAKL